MLYKEMLSPASRGCGDGVRRRTGGPGVQSASFSIRLPRPSHGNTCCEGAFLAGDGPTIPGARTKVPEGPRHSLGALCKLPARGREFTGSRRPG